MEAPPAADQQGSSAIHPNPAASRMSRRGGWSIKKFLALLLLLLLIGTAGVYFAWDYMPARVQYIPLYLQTHLLPQRPRPSFVPTPAAVAAPEQVLENIRRATQPESPTPLPTEPSSPPVAAASGPVAEASPTAALSPTPPPAPTATPAPRYTLPGASARLEGIRHEYQGWNNCGPATLAMNLSYFGRSETQAETAPFLKPDKNDKNVSPDEMAAYAHSIGYGAQVVVGLDLERLRTFVANGLPVIVESWYIPEPDDEMGHYLLLTGYEGETLHFFDSYNGPNVQEQAAEFDALWKVFNRTAIVVWSPEQEELARAIIGERNDPTTMYRLALEQAQAEIEADPQDKFAWFNLGTNLTALGQYEGAVQAFDTARSLRLPWRMLWYQFAPYEAYYEQGAYEEVIGLATTTLDSASNLEESHYWRGRAHAALGNIEAARQDFQQAIRLNPNFKVAQEALGSLP